MDKTNRALLRLEALLGLGVAVTLAVLHLREIRWAPFALFFVTIDLVGFLPGAIAQARARERAVSPVFHGLYNTTHSFFTNGLVALVWTLAVGPEWALLAIPIHLLGDRALFGNFFKPLQGAFA